MTAILLICSAAIRLVVALVNYQISNKLHICAAVVTVRNHCCK